MTTYIIYKRFPPDANFINSDKIEFDVDENTNTVNLVEYTWTNNSELFWPASMPKHVLAGEHAWKLKDSEILSIKDARKKWNDLLRQGWVFDRAVRPGKKTHI
tara:strand:+ start:7066 stop:7374 length:309 start_codon:yes stop_codon:yes gene_type:complete